MTIPEGRAARESLCPPDFFPHSTSGVLHADDFLALSASGWLNGESGPLLRPQRTCSPTTARTNIIFSGSLTVQDGAAVLRTSQAIVGPFFKKKCTQIFFGPAQILFQRTLGGGEGVCSQLGGAGKKVLAGCVSRMLRWCFVSLCCLSLQLPAGLLLTFGFYFFDPVTNQYIPLGSIASSSPVTARVFEPFQPRPGQIVHGSCFPSVAYFKRNLWLSVTRVTKSLNCPRYPVIISFFVPLPHL